MRIFDVKLVFNEWLLLDLLLRGRAVADATRARRVMVDAFMVKFRMDRCKKKICLVFQRRGERMKSSLDMRVVRIHEIQLHIRYS